jgi:hypothetical protein
LDSLGFLLDEEEDEGELNEEDGIGEFTKAKVAKGSVKEEGESAKEEDEEEVALQTRATLLDLSDFLLESSVSNDSSDKIGIEASSIDTSSGMLDKGGDKDTAPGVGHEQLDEEHNLSGWTFLPEEPHGRGCSEKTDRLEHEFSLGV